MVQACLRLSNSFNWHGGRKVNKLQIFIQTDIDSSYFSGCNSTRPYIVTPRNAYNHLELYAISNIQNTTNFHIKQRGYSKNPCIKKIMHYSCMHCTICTVFRTSATHEMDHFAVSISHFQSGRTTSVPKAIDKSTVCSHGRGYLSYSAPVARPPKVACALQGNCWHAQGVVNAVQRAVLIGLCAT